MKKYGKPIVFGLVLIAFSVVAATFPVRDWIQAFANWVEQLGWTGVAVFIGVYAIATILLFPGWIFTVASGLIFGVVGGTAAAWRGISVSRCALPCPRQRSKFREIKFSISGDRPGDRRKWLEDRRLAPLESAHSV